MYMLNVPPVAWALLPPPPLSLPPHADSIIAAAMPAATSAPLRFLNFTCNASLIPRRRGERTGRSAPSGAVGRLTGHERNASGRQTSPRYDGVDPSAPSRWSLR